MDTSREVEFEGFKAPRTVDIGAAVREVMDGSDYQSQCGGGTSG